MAYQSTVVHTISKKFLNVNACKIAIRIIINLLQLNIA